MALNDGVSVIRGNTIDNIEHHAPADAKKIVIASADGSGNGVDIDANGNIGAVLNDSVGNTIDSHVDADGGYHLGASLIQSIITSTNNSTTTNLASTATFTGTYDETFGVNGIQVFHASDQTCTIYIDQSTDDDFPDTVTVTDSFECLANTPCSRTFISVAPYYRMRVTNNGASTTTSLATYTGMTPIINPLPRSLSPDGRLETETTIAGRENTSRHVWVNPTNELAISPVYRMVGTAFDGTTLDSNFWEPTLVNGSITQAGGAITLQTSAAANSSAKYVSKRKARFVPGSAQLFQAGLGMTVAPVAGNTRRVGAYDTNNGFFMQVAGTTFSIGYRKATSDTLVSTGSFNGNYGVSWSPELNTFYKVQIEFTPLAAIWYINGVKLHSVNTQGLSDTLTLPITIENINVANTTDVDLVCVGAYIARQGELFTNQTSKFIQGTGTDVCKYGAGVVKGIVISDVVDDTVVSFYDGSTTSDLLLWSSGGIQAKTDYEPIPVDLFGLPFSDGLTIAITVEDCNVLVIYE